MTLAELAQLLRKQAETNSTLVLDDTVFATSVLDQLRTAFALPDGQNVTITGVGSSDIPDPTNGTLQISAGTVDVLSQKGVGIGLTFTEPAGSLEAVISAEMGHTWKFGDSFPSLGQIFPFENLAVSSARFVYATVEQPKFAWPDDASFKFDLGTGLNFLSDLDLQNFTVIGQLLAKLIGDASFKFYGPFSPVAGQPLPVCEIRAPVSSGSFPIGKAPFGVELDCPAVAVRIGKNSAIDPIQRVDLDVIADYKKTLEFSVGIPVTGKTLSIDTKPLPHMSSIQQLIESLPGGADFTKYIPSELESVFDEIGLQDFSMVFDLTTPKVSYLGLAIDTTSPWTVISKVLILENLCLELNIIDPSGLDLEQVSISASAEFLPKIFKNGEFDFTVNLEKQTSWEVSSVTGAYYGSVNLGDIVGGILGSQDTVPAALRDISFSNFSVSATRDAPGAEFTYTFWGGVEAAFPISGQELTAQLEIQVTKASSGTSIELNGQMVVGSESFSLKLDLGKADSQLVAKWAALDQPLEFEDLAEAFGFTDMPKIPPDLDLALESAGLSYDFTKKVLVLTAQSANYGSAVFFADTLDSGASIYAFGIDVPLDVNFGEIPVVGTKIPDAKDFGIQNPGIWVLSTSIKKEQIAGLNQEIAKVATDGPFLLDEELTARVLLGATLELGPSYQQLLELRLGSTTSVTGPAPARRALMTVDLEQTPPPPAGNGKVTPPKSSPDGAKWIDVQKTIGPLSLQRLGLKYADSELYFMVDLGFTAGGLTIDLAGLSVSSPVTSFSASFHLSGLEIEYKSSAFEIAGEFLNVPKSQLPEGTDFEYAGAATLTAGTFDLTALGSYARVSGQTSLFVFAVLELPLGGPPFFFVTGAAAGFGFNRNLLLPEVNEVSNFPLVAAAMNPQEVFPGGSNQTTSLSQALGILDKYIPPDPGEYWLAAGIRFTSFEMLSSFALLSVAFGNQPEIALLGKSQLSLPADPTGKNPDNPKIANVELVLEVKIEPDAGIFQASAVLTQNSWLLAESCRLTGGFAFYIWWAGEHAGDFVITLGGYNPHYQPAKWYPNEPRLGFDWQVSSVLTMKGGCYFVLTPHAIMAGGGLQLLFQTGGLKAWLTAYADFLIEWQPFFYEIDVGVLIGVSYTFSILGAKITIGVETGASLDLWGAPFGGRATVHLWIISFTIHFGDQTKAPKALSFDEFNQALLPKSEGDSRQPFQASAMLAAGERDEDFDADGTENQLPIFIKLNISAGILESPTSNKSLTMPIVAARALEIQVTSNWPAVELFQNPGSDAKDLKTLEPKKIFDYDGDLFVSPMHGTDPFGSTLSVQVIYEDKQEVCTNWFVCVPILKNAPTAVWGKWNPDGPSINPPAVTVPRVPFGISLRAGPETDEDPGAVIPLQNFASEPDWICVSWPDYQLPVSISGDGIRAIQGTISGDSTVDTTRDAILAKLAKAGIKNLPTAIVVGLDLSQHPDNVFLAVPEVANLGQVPSGNDG